MTSLTSMFYLSNVALWIAVIALILSVYKMRKHIRAVNAERMSRLLQKDHGFPIGTMYPKVSLSTIGGTPVSLRNTTGRGTIVAITAAGCPSCKTLYPSLNRIHEENTGILVVSVMTGEENSVRDVITEFDLRVPVHRAEPIQSEHYGSVIYPFGYFLSPEGKVLSKGLITNMEQINLMLSSANMKRLRAVSN